MLVWRRVLWLVWLSVCWWSVGVMAATTTFGDVVRDPWSSNLRLAGRVVYSTTLAASWRSTVQGTLQQIRFAPSSTAYTHHTTTHNIIQTAYIHIQTQSHTSTHCYTQSHVILRNFVDCTKIAQLASDSSAYNVEFLFDDGVLMTVTVLGSVSVGRAEVRWGMRTYRSS